MNVLAFVSEDWHDYSLLMRKMTVLIEDVTKNYPDDRTITFVHAAQNAGENMVTEYVDRIRSFMSQKGYNIDEKVIYYKKYSDMDMINRGADEAIIFSTKGCHRTDRAAKILSISNIPTTIVRG